MLGMVIHEPLEQLLSFCDDFTHQIEIAKLTKQYISQMWCTPLYAQPRVLRHAMQTLEHFPRQYVVACAVHPNNAEVVLEVEAEELTVVEDLEGLLRNELRIFGATICHMSRRIDALEEDRPTRR